MTEGKFAALEAAVAWGQTVFRHGEHVPMSRGTLARLLAEIIPIKEMNAAELEVIEAAIACLDHLSPGGRLALAVTELLRLRAADPERTTR